MVGGNDAEVLETTIGRPTRALRHQQFDRKSFNLPPWAGAMCAPRDINAPPYYRRQLDVALNSNFGNFQHVCSPLKFNFHQNSIFNTELAAPL